MNYEKIAKIAHEVNRGYCLSMGDNSQVAWEETTDELKASVINGVKLIHEAPETTPEQSHQSWMEQKLADGWVCGYEKDVEAKIHPCLVPYSELPQEHRAKDFIFGEVVRSQLLQATIHESEIVEAVNDSLAEREIQHQTELDDIRKELESTQFNSSDDQRTDNNTLRHQYKQLTEQEKEYMDHLKQGAQVYLDAIREVMLHYPNTTREMSLAETRLEESVMWAIKHITK